ncbi:hypothetical protein [Sinomonas atrocyanea]|uniref:hypothetical protein n=1 Tax=Sinomonas atrocyanea TaxID=37927 RepID=UPI00278B7529|nr:hypothetical protein [Sinomonas atrocyanea]MDQ0261410.1 hypothetical protein [Sinomonas atrocyanea]MDR6623535.1 hypothetical protein [Sinomonas atrocyanea]
MDIDGEIDGVSARVFPDDALATVMDLFFGVNDENGPGASFLITVSVGGSVVRGEAIPFEAWLLGVCEGIRGAEGAQPAVAKAFGDAYETVLSAAVENGRRTHAEHPADRRWLHLRNAITDGPFHAQYGPNGDAAPDFQYVRVRIDRVNAWSLA